MFYGFTLTELIIFGIAIILSLAFHEAMHAFASHALGDRTAYEEGRLTLNPLKHLDLFTSVILPFVLVLLRMPPIFIAKPVPFNPRNVRYGEWGVALIGLAGPITNFLLATVAALFAKMAGIAVGTAVFDFVSIFILVNLSFFVFNLVPFPPLDGSRLLYAFAPDSVREIMERLEAGGLATIGLYMIIFFLFLSGPISNIISTLYDFLLR